MSSTAVRKRYDAISMLLHWVTAVLMIPMIFFGEELMEAGEEAGEAAVEAIGTFGPSLHVSIGIAILLLTLLRIVWRLVNPSPALPAGMAGWEILVTKITHGLFYILMIGLPLSGWLAFPYFLQEAPAMAGVQVFGLFPVPGAPAIGEFVKGIHNLGSKVAMVLVILHVLAAVKHQFINRDDVLRRMLPH
jgi:cytochrome b561